MFRPREFWAACTSTAGQVGALTLLALGMAACGGGPNRAEATALPPVDVPVQPTVVFPTLVPIEPGPTLTPTPEQPVEETVQVDNQAQVLAPITEGTVNSEGLRFRNAPNTGTGFILAELGLNTPLYVFGRNAESNWLNVAREPSGARGWVFASYVNLDRPTEQLPVVSVSEEGTPLLEAEPTIDTRLSPLVTQFFIEAVAVPLQDIELRDAPNGTSLARVPEGEYVTALAQSEDGLWLAVYTNALQIEDRLYGWVASSSVKLYGGDDLPRTSNNAPWLELLD